MTDGSGERISGPALTEAGRVPSPWNDGLAPSHATPAGPPGPTHQLQGPGARRRAFGPTAGHLATRDQERPEQPDRNVGSEFTALRIRPADRDIPRADDGTLPEQWLIAEWPNGKTERTDFWISNLPADTPIAALVRLATIRRRIEHDNWELKMGVGLDHFEGRSWIGWHNHATLATAAHVFLTWLRLANPTANGRA